ncbi:ATP-binding protein [Armatimonas sp.]|uniref:ATP-binding protein n=1 Tax=Armatimonas sp. TaxID=1872638 RepID=UPI00375394AD
MATINVIPGRVLLILDNLEHLLPSDIADDADEEKSRFGAARVVRQLLESCPKLVILATSRQPLGVEGEQQALVEPLAETVGVELFMDRARAVRPDFVQNSGNQGEIAAICTLLDGLPLAIELAAAWVRVLSLKELRGQLKKEVLWLEGRRRDQNPRQKSLEATLRWSWQLLSVGEKNLLCALSVFRGGWTIEAAEAVGALPDTRDLLYSLVEKSVVIVEPRPDETRYRFLETIRQFAHERLAESGDEAAFRAVHLAHFLALAEAAEPNLTGPEQGIWLNCLELEHNNLRAALSWSCKFPQTGALGLRLTGALWRFWVVHGYFAEGREYLTKVLLSNEGGVPLVRAKALQGAGVLARMQGDYASARALNEENLALRRELDDRQGIAMALNNLGNLAQDQSDYVSACKLYEESLALKRELGDRQGISNSLNNLGGVAYYQGEHASSQALYGESLAIEQELGNPTGIARSLGNLGVVAYYQGDYTLAQVLHKKSLAIKRELGNPLSIALSLEELAALRAVTNAPLLASQLWGAVESLREQIASPQSSQAHERQAGQVAAIRATLGDNPAFDAAWAEGRALTREQAIALALDGGLT